MIFINPQGYMGDSKRIIIHYCFDSLAKIIEIIYDN